MERNRQKAAVVNLLVLLVVSAGAYAVARHAHLLAGQAAVAFLGLGVLIAAVSWFQMRLEEQERLEKLEFDEVTRAAGGAALFKTDEAEAFRARRAREQFERFMVPGFTALLMLLEAGAAWWLWRWLAKPAGLPLERPLLAMSFLGLFALVLFLLGKYSATVARLEQQRLLQPGANCLLLGAYLCALVAAGIVAVEGGFPKVDLYLARGFCVLLGLLAVETLVSLVLEIYRPRMKGKLGPPLYESRLVGLVSRPEGLFTTAAHALDYQFGFKVSETWFYKFLQQAIAWLVLAQAALLVLSTSFVFIEVGEQALWERFGKPVGQGVIGPGFHLKLPWPMDRVHRFRTDQLQTFTVGSQHAEHAEHEGHAHDGPGTTLWTVSHTKEEFLLLVASHESPDTTTNVLTGKKSPPVNLLASSIPVQFTITNLLAWACNHQNPGDLLQHIGTREVVRYLVNADVQEITSRGRFPASEELRRRIQARADELQMGVQIVFVGLQDIHPPVKVAGAYEAVVSARQKKQAALLEAEAHKAQTNALADAERLRRLRAAEAERRRLEVSALARAALFTNQLPAFQAAPGVYAERAYLQTLVRGSSGARRYILNVTNTDDVVQLNLEEKFRDDAFLNLPLPAPAKPK